MFNAIKTSYLIGLLFLKYPDRRDYSYIRATNPPPTSIFFVPSFKQVPRTAFMRGLKSKHAGKQVRTKQINDLHILQHELETGVRLTDTDLETWLAATLRSLCGNQAAFVSFYGWAAHDYIWLGPCKSLLTAV